MTQGGWHEVVLPGDTNRLACDHLLRHYQQGDFQEDLCFGSWTSSCGMDRETAIVTDVILPNPGERTPTAVRDYVKRTTHHRGIRLPSIRNSTKSYR